MTSLSLVSVNFFLPPPLFRFPQKTGIGSKIEHNLTRQIGQVMYEETPMFTEAFSSPDLGELRHFLVSERQKVLSEAEWKFRMRGYGFHVKRIDGGVMVARIPKNEILGCVKM
ncbi:MAG: hypothetical protein ACSHXH_08610 [Marivita sp.]